MKVASRIGNFFALKADRSSQFDRVNHRGFVYEDGKPKNCRIDRQNVLQTCRNNLRGKLRKTLVWKRSKTKHVKGKGRNEPKRDYQYQNVRSRVSLP